MNMYEGYAKEIFERALKKYDRDLERIISDFSNDIVINGNKISLVNYFGDLIGDISDLSDSTFFLLEEGASQKELAEGFKIIKETFISLVYGKISENPNPSFYEGMKIVLYFRDFPLSFYGKYKYIYEFLDQLSSDIIYDDSRRILSLAKSIDKFNS